MAPTAPPELPSIAAILTPVTVRLPPRQQRLLIAHAERQAAEMYRSWAAQVDKHERDGFLRCAEREEEIAAHVEAIEPAADTLRRQLKATLPPDLDAQVRAVYAGRPLEEQWEIQRRAERAGKRTWENFAAAESDPTGQAVLRTCAAMEDESASFLVQPWTDENRIEEKGRGVFVEPSSLHPPSPLVGEG